MAPIKILPSLQCILVSVPNLIKDSIIEALAGKLSELYKIGRVQNFLFLQPPVFSAI